MRKKGELAEGFVWFIAVVVIFFVMVIFVVGTFAFTTVKKVSGQGNEIVIGNEGFENLRLQRDLINFLEKEVEFEDEAISLYELILVNDIELGEASEIFNKAGNEFLEENYPASGVMKEMVWLGVFGPGVAGDSFYGLGGNEAFHSGGKECVPTDYARSIVIDFFAEEKRIILCIDKRYFG